MPMPTHLRQVDALTQEQRGKDQDEHRHAAEQQGGEAGGDMGLAVVEQVVRQAEVAQGDEDEKAQVAARKEDRVTADQGEGEEQREGDEKAQAGGGQRRYGLHGNLDAQPGGAPAQAHGEE